MSKEDKEKLKQELNILCKKLNTCKPIDEDLRKEAEKITIMLLTSRTRNSVKRY